MTTNSHLNLRRGMFVGVNLCLLIAVYLLTVRPMTVLLSDQTDRLAQARIALLRYRAITAQEESVRSAATRAEDAASSAAFLQGASDGAINAGLQARLKAIADRAGARVQSIRAREPMTDGGIRFLRAHLELAGPIGAIYTTLQAIEGREPYLFVDAAFLRLPPGPPGIAPAQEPSIEAQLDVYGPVRHHATGH